MLKTIYLDQLEEMKAPGCGGGTGRNAGGAETHGQRLHRGWERILTVTQVRIRYQRRQRTKLEDIDSIAGGMSDEETVAYYLSKHPELKGCFWGQNADAVCFGGWRR